ncbi:hypothetical protein GIB67_035594, partial [Kingdonia uniflora]
ETTVEEVTSLRNGLELVRSASDKLLRPSARYLSVSKGEVVDPEECEKGKYMLIRDVEEYQQGLYDKPLTCFGCGIGLFL